MTKIVKFNTKKELKEAVKNNNDFFINDPSIINPKSLMVSEMKEGDKCVVTNHPKRSWFASIENKNGRIVVK